MAKRQKLRCADWCGSGCTEQEYQQAVRDAKALARRLGAEWQPNVWENMGWHFHAISACGRLKVSDHKRNRKSHRFTAFLGPANHMGGRWVESGATPIAAVRAVVQEGIQSKEKTEALLCGLTKEVPQ